MKKIMIVAAILMLSAFVMAQNTKKVAILETVDKENRVEYGVELQLRGYLTDAINRTPGYEGYDRVDMASIMGEHNFQRTGYVSDAQIKKLGQMTGASSIIVAEAAMYGSDRIMSPQRLLMLSLHVLKTLQDLKWLVPVMTIWLKHARSLQSNFLG